MARASLLPVCLLFGACSHDPGHFTGVVTGGADAGTAGVSDGAVPDMLCGSPCAGCPDGQVCVWGRFLPECVTPCNDDRDCTALKLGCIDIGFRICTNGNPPDINHPTHPTPCTRIFCSPPGPHERCDGDVLVVDEPVYCGKSRRFCPNGCVTVPDPDPLDRAAYCQK